MNIFQTFSRRIIKKSFHFSVWTIERFYDMSTYEEQMAELRNLPTGTLGRDIAECLDAHKLRLVPNFESHDLKHTLLNYKMTPEDEIRMQAFMIGNGNYSVASIAILLFGLVLVPDLFTLFYTDFKKGRCTKPIKYWTIEAFAKKQTLQLRNEIFNYDNSYQTDNLVRNITKVVSVSILIAGVSGMLYCLPFLFSASAVDILGAGFPFMGGAILVSGSVIALSNLSKKQLNKLSTLTTESMPS